jgi:uncharacterized membrane protein
MAEITKSIEIDLPVEVIFDYVSNPHNTVKYSPQFTKFEPVSSQERGLGAKVSASGNFMGITIKTTLEITEFEENKRFVSTSTDGVKSTSIWEFKPLEENKTEVVFTSDYTVPGKKLGWLLDKMMVSKDVEKTTIETLVNLKKILEKRPNLKAVHASKW